MNINDKQQWRKILLTFSIAAIGIIIVSSLLLISKAIETRDSAITMEMVVAAYTELQNRYGERNFGNQKYILELLRTELNTYKDSNFLKDGFTAQAEYKEMIYDILKRNALYQDFIYIAFVESLYNPVAENKSGAKGMWQLMPTTARSFGLRVNETVDERLDPVKSTVAAARYIKHLQENFGQDAFTIILAAYNTGEGNILNSALKAESSAATVSFWDLLTRDLIPDQTKAFVLRTITFLILGEDLLPTGDSEPAVVNQ